MTNLLIIGGSDAGISAALRAKEIDPVMDVMVLVADRFPNYSICGLPFYLSGEVSDWHTLAHRTTNEIARLKEEAEKTPQENKGTFSIQTILDLFKTSIPLLHISFAYSVQIPPPQYLKQLVCERRR
jgi:hypothetical protein